MIDPETRPRAPRPRFALPSVLAVALAPALSVAARAFADDGSDACWNCRKPASVSIRMASA